MHTHLRFFAHATLLNATTPSVQAAFTDHLSLPDALYGFSLLRKKLPEVILLGPLFVINLVHQIAVLSLRAGPPTVLRNPSLTEEETGPGRPPVHPWRWAITLLESEPRSYQMPLLWVNKAPKAAGSRPRFPPGKLLIWGIDVSLLSLSCLFYKTS